MNIKEKIKYIAELTDSIKVYEKMIADIDSSLKLNKLELIVINGSNDGHVLNYKNREYSKTNLIKIGLEAMKLSLEEEMSLIEKKLEDMFKDGE